MEGNLQAAKDRWKASLVEDKAARANAVDAPTAKAKAAAFKAKVDEDASKAERLAQKARIAETKAEAFLAKKAKVAKEIAQTAFEAN